MRSCQEPSIGIAGGANHDVPCTGEPPEGCATPIVLDPEAVAAARPLQLATFDVPLDHVGHYEVQVGDVGLPNGYLDVAARRRGGRASDRLLAGRADPPRAAARRTRAARRSATSTSAGPSRASRTPSVWLVFDVTEVSPGAVLRLVDIDVR